MQNLVEIAARLQQQISADFNYMLSRLTKTKLMLKRELMLLSEVKQALAAMSEKMVARTEQMQMVKALTVLSEKTVCLTELREMTEAPTTEQKQRKRIGIL